MSRVSSGPGDAADPRRLSPLCLAPAVASAPAAALGLLVENKREIAHDPKNRQEDETPTKVVQKVQRELIKD
ncbi:hypothetical protein NDU88_006148 [Pleurodeles waltl]|uniref:Uncharacterized protein n=1 Tax=Pleurodeles waltl TaxID=8319 RepID=A0AAV7QH90_PLEWA|nr:hypothetical protein NDU88_006148 [Pleurodeles waltl]